jgi:hypothetical protein
MIETDYLVVGAGAMGMAFVDVILDETDATVTIVDRANRPGGHWNDAYPFVRLHQPSTFYGVNSRPLGSDRVDTDGWNAGLYELASGAEVLAYYDQVMNQQFIPSGRVTYFPMHEFTETDAVAERPDSGRIARFASRVNGETTEVLVRRKLVDATYMNVTVPAQRPPAYDIADRVRHGPVNALGTLTEPADHYTIVGAGKTGADACLFLLRNGADPDTITWITPRDSWFLDRALIQPGDFFETTATAFIEQFRCVAESTSIPDLFNRLERAGLLLRLDESVEPSMYRCSTITTAERDQLRRITDIIRLGRVQRIGADAIVLDEGTIPTTSNTFHVDCTADGLERRPAIPVFDGDRLTLQTVRHCQQVFSAAFIAHVEAAYDDVDEKNTLCGVVPHPDSATDWIRTAYGNSLNSANWNADPELTAWLAAARLDGFTTTEPPSDELVSVMMGALEHAEPALAKLERYVAELDAADVTPGAWHQV